VLTRSRLLRPTEPEYLQLVDFEHRGVPIGRPPEVGLRNQHAQYIFTWYSLAIATSVMFYMVVKRPSGYVRRINLNQ
jgi:surfeit locus 1 family protein